MREHVFLFCRLHSLKFILAFVYIPPPYKNQTLGALLEYQLKYPDKPLYVMGDFNCSLDPGMDKHALATAGGVTRTDWLKKNL